jgi:hypothetical protein
MHLYIVFKLKCRSPLFPQLSAMLSKHTSSSRSSSSSVSQPAKSNKDVSLSATSFYSGSDLKAMYCPVSGDPPGLYVLLFNQGVTHGSQALKDNNLLLPYMSCLHDMSDRQLQTLMLRHYNTNGAVVVCFDEKANTRKELVNAWQKDLNEIGGEIPPGKPNSKSTGLLRSNGLCFGRFACKLRDHDQLQRCWKLLATGVGREDPFRKPKHSVSQPVFLTSFDAVLRTADSAKFKGLKPHQDIYPPPNEEEANCRLLCMYTHLQQDTDDSDSLPHSIRFATNAFGATTCKLYCADSPPRRM